MNRRVTRVVRNSVLFGVCASGCLLIDPPNQVRHGELSESGASGEAGDAPLAGAHSGGTSGTSGTGGKLSQGGAANAGNAGESGEGGSSGDTDMHAGAAGTTAGSAGISGMSAAGMGGSSAGSSGSPSFGGSAGSGAGSGGTSGSAGSAGSPSECVTACSGATPVCSSTTKTCVRATCDGVPATCGPEHKSDCCGAHVVTGGSYNRINDSTYPATVADFRLDDYEISVARFRKFWKDYPSDAPVNGTGKNPNNPSDPGWTFTGNGVLPFDQAALTTDLKCDTKYQSWSETAGTNDYLPMNCLSWYEASAFCIWDGGRLPTEAEFNYVAAGGNNQWLYPWGPNGADETHAVFNCYYYGTGLGSTCTSLMNIAPVGSIPAGNSVWGQSDIAGNMWEWVLDWYNPTLTAGSCNNCAQTTITNSTAKVYRGGCYDEGGAYLPSTYRGFGVPSSRVSRIGARCARAAQ